MAPTPPVSAPLGVKKRSQRGSYKTLTMVKKAEIIRQVEGGRPQSEVAREFSIFKQTVSDYLKQKANPRFMTGIEEDSATGQYPTVESPPTAAADILDDLRASGVDVGASTYEEFANFDSAVLPCAELDDDEIVRQVCEPALAGSDSDNDALTAPQPSNGDLAQAISMLLSVYSNGQTLSEVQADVVALKRVCVQTHIDSFFR
ncbi:hypothetical protein HPB51_000900 [Rhipicephalus microplus]|uniref:HTH psq-type domain-containing protein n=1 Tax=Rhipicephalus microplus TaxID=6941 RepID=A0A9J6DL78_RHIMP|nr:hypothetical protein HPB51_000900 [Rhipicephalus microplus]